MIRRWLCYWFGHKPAEGPLHHSPWTVYTHWRDVHCARCGKELGSTKEYIDARSWPAE